MARCRRTSSNIVRVSSRLCRETSLSSLDDVAQGKLGAVGITMAEQIDWRARRQSTTSLRAKGLWRQDLGDVVCTSAGGASVSRVTCRRRFSISMLRTIELRQVPDMPIQIAMEWLFVHAWRERCRAVLLDRHGSTPLRRSQGGRGCRSNATDISMREGSVPRRGSRLSQ